MTTDRTTSRPRHRAGVGPEAQGGVIPAGPGARSSVRLLRFLAALVASLLCAVAGQVVTAAPAYAHAELVDTSPGNGERLDEPPTEVVLRFTEKVSVVEGAFRLLDTATGADVATPGAEEEPPDGATVRFALPQDLPDGSYLVSWRVVSTDSHPIGGAFAFGVGEAAEALTAAEVADVAGSAPWPVTATRAIGYTAFAAVAGSLALALLWGQGRADPRLRRLRGAGVVVGVAASVLALLLEGPYVAGVSMWRLFEPEVMAHLAHGQFGTWIHLRVLLYLLLGGVLWLPDALDQSANRWLAGLSVVGIAATYPGTGHAAAADNLLEPAADALHALAAGVWAGGLLALLVLARARGPRPGAEVFARFSRLALGAVLVLVATGTLAAVVQLGAWDDLWDSRYGQLLSVKLLLVAAVLATALVARRTVRAGGSPWRPVRYEAVGTVAVLALTAALGVTPPPTRGSDDAAAGSATAADRTTVALDLGNGRTAELEVDGLTTSGSRLRLTVPAPRRGPQAVRRVTLRAELPGEGLGAADVPLTREGDRWRGVTSFVLPGRWQLTLSVERRNLDAVVTTGTLSVR